MKHKVHSLSRSYTYFYICNFVFFFSRRTPPASCILYVFQPQKCASTSAYVPDFEYLDQIYQSREQNEKYMYLIRWQVCVCVSVTKPSCSRKGHNPVVTKTKFYKRSNLRNGLFWRTPSESLYQRINYFQIFKNTLKFH